MKLHEQLIEIVEHGHIESVLTEAAERITQLDSDNAALTKRVAELEEIAAGRAQLIDDQRETIESLQSQLEAKDKRVAELEHEAMMLRGSIAARDEISERHLRVREELAQRVLDLKSQLAWTPVSAGLPTEPGLYQFIEPDRTTTIWEFGTELWVEYTQPEDPWSLRQMKGHVDTFFTHYRRIELPKDGES